MIRGKYIVNYDQLSELTTFSETILTVENQPDKRRVIVHVIGNGDVIPDGAESPVIAFPDRDERLERWERLFITLCGGVNASDEWSDGVHALREIIVDGADPIPVEDGGWGTVREICERLNIQQHTL